MVAPSLVTITSPVELTIILSSPTGPRLLLITLAIAMAAVHFSRPKGKKNRPVSTTPQRPPDVTHVLLARLVPAEPLSLNAQGALRNHRVTHLAASVRRPCCKPSAVHSPSPLYTAALCAFSTNQKVGRRCFW